MGFKEDESFLRYLSMGARGAASVAADLQSRQGHRVIELERYAMANKLWVTKVKRLRLPDLMCLRCGTRIEARAKSALQIKLSHSDTAGREWDAGMRDEDLYAFVHCVITDSGSVLTGTPQYFSTEGLRSVRESAKLGSRKAASQGSEIDLTWPTRVPKCAGEVVAVGDHEVVTLLINGRRQTYRLSRELHAYPYVQVGDSFGPEDRFLLGAVPPVDANCRGNTWDSTGDLCSTNAVDRYAAVKAIGASQDEAHRSALEDVAADADEDLRIRLEALGSLALLDPDWTESLRAIAEGGWQREDLAMEATLILSELGSEAAVENLLIIAQTQDLNEELRAAAVWGLGCCGANRQELILRFIGDGNDVVAVHALGAIGDLSVTNIPELKAMLSSHDQRVSAAAMTMLVRHDQVDALSEVAHEAGTARTWALYGLGLLPRDMVTATLGPDDHEIERILAPMWLGHHDNWLRGENERQLELMSSQHLSRPVGRIAEHLSPAVDRTV